MNEVIRQIQSTRDNCVSELWNPKVDDASAILTTGCYAAITTPLYKSPLDAKIGDLTVPRSLYNGFVVGTSTIRKTSGRDSDNNIVVYWSGTPGNTPADASKCWLFVSRLNVWDENY